MLESVGMKTVTLLYCSVAMLHAHVPARESNWPKRCGGVGRVCCASAALTRLSSKWYVLMTGCQRQLQKGEPWCISYSN
ncbi:hypothetical protein F4679DRAFT_533028 [Xylaria curta]|nr:hypothetical protein F4679DRAFT_533028 [Xylaria curta]